MKDEIKVGDWAKGLYTGKVCEVKTINYACNYFCDKNNREWTLDSFTKIQPWEVGTYVVFLKNFGGHLKGTVSKIVEDNNSCTRVEALFKRSGDYCNPSKNKQAKWFPTKELAEEYAKTLSPKKPEELKAYTGKFKKGDKVKLVRKARSKEGDWSNSWVDTMTKYIGLSAVIKHEPHNGYFIHFNSKDTYHYPEFVLELVEDKVEIPKSQYKENDCVIIRGINGKETCGNIVKVRNIKPGYIYSIDILGYGVTKCNILNIIRYATQEEIMIAMERKELYQINL